MQSFMSLLLAKISTPTEASRRVEQWRTDGDSVVWTNGCFDLLHRGHVRYLEAAAALGDHLVVGLNDDHSVARLKGPTRPVVPLDARLEVIAALESVSLVTWFAEDTPLEMIETLKPDVLVKGGDYTPAEIVGAREVVSWGGRVEVIEYVEGSSTSDLIQRARDD